jgi:hypothetical protein
MTVLAELLDVAQTGAGSAVLVEGEGRIGKMARQAGARGMDVAGINGPAH